MTTLFRKNEAVPPCGRTTPALALNAPYTIPVVSGLHTQYHTDRWKVYSPKLGRDATFYGTAAYLHWLLIEADPDVETFCEQPLKIKIRLPLGEVTTLFDIWIKSKSGKEEFRAIRSNKPDAASRASRQIEAQRFWCEMQGIEYSIVTSTTITSNPAYLSNCKFLIRYVVGLRDRKTTSIRGRILDCLSSINAFSMADMKGLFPELDDQILFGIICELIINRQIQAPLRTSLLTLKTELGVSL